MLLCSKATPEHCHRSLVAEYLHRKWGDIEIVHQNQELARRLFPIYAAIPMQLFQVAAGFWNTERKRCLTDLETPSPTAGSIQGSLLGQIQHIDIFGVDLEQMMGEQEACDRLGLAAPCVPRLGHGSIPPTFVRE